MFEIIQNLWLRYINGYRSIWKGKKRLLGLNINFEYEF